MVMRGYDEWKSREPERVGGTSATHGAFRANADTWGCFCGERFASEHAAQNHVDEIKRK